MLKKQGKSESNAKKATPVNKVGITFWRSVFLIFFILLFLSLVSYSSNDLTILAGGKEGHLHNWIGLVGAFSSRIMLLVFGLGAYLFSLLFLICVFQSFFPKPYYKRKGFIFVVLLIIVGVSMLFGMWPEFFIDITDYLGIGSIKSPYFALSGGVLGQFLAAPKVLLFDYNTGIIRQYIGTVGTAIVAISFIIAGSVFLWRTEITCLYRALFIDNLKKELIKEKIKDDKKDSIDNKIDQQIIKDKIKDRRRKEREELKQAKIDKKNEKNHESSHDAKPVSNPKKDIISLTSPRSTVSRKSTYKLPTYKQLKDLNESRGDSKATMDAAKETLQDTLTSFGVDAKVMDAVTGPRVTRLEIVPSPGVRVQRISSLEPNIKLDLKAESIRILAPIPGRDAVGIEIPNRSSSMVALKSILASKQWTQSSAEIPVVLGRNVEGKPVIMDLARAPHLLIAGSTGSGKSVCVNTLIMSLLFCFSPSELRLIMVDPKVVEFEMYRKLPHLITPIVNEPKKVPLALRWSINEMEKRYKLLAKVRVKNLEGFNARPISSEPIMDDDGDPVPAKLPYIVIIIDELADIMMVAKADVETSIARIAQKARAVGIHLVLATQRPSVQIITGIIKANLPTRIAFRVSSVMDSRVILDHKGAETLLGKGDMLFIPPNSSKLDRIQGAMVSDDEIENIVSHCSSQVEQNFDGKVVVAETENKDVGEKYSPKSVKNGDDDDIVQKAIDIILNERKASTSYLQRRLKIGYNRAAEIIDIIEDRGIIGPQIGSARREIFLEKE